MDKTAEQEEVRISQARRRLLKAGAYVPPAILGMAIISSMPGTTEAAATWKASCKPSACKPCIDLATSPQLTAKELKKLQAQCAKAQQKMP
jgi:hypothetical protein